jgi:hypothetical protein
MPFWAIAVSGVWGPAPVILQCSFLLQSLDDLQLTSPLSVALLDISQCIFTDSKRLLREQASNHSAALFLGALWTSQAIATHLSFSTKNPAFLRTSKIMTLIPEKMSAMGQEVYAISSDDSITINAAQDDGKPQFEWHGQNQNTDKRGYYRRFPFPPGTRGVFYYHQPPGRPSIAGELRFRVCDSVSHFFDGTDLTTGWGSYWQSPLYWIVKMNTWESVLKLLVDEGCVQQQVVDDVRRLPRIKTSEHRQYLYDLDQPFLVHLDSLSLEIAFITRHSVNLVNFKRLFASRLTCPYKGECFLPLLNDLNVLKTRVQGLIRARFERSTIDPDHNTEEKTTLVLRVLEVLTPIELVIPGEHHLIAEPHPGQLLLRRKKGPAKNFEPWTFPVSIETLDPNSNALRKFLPARMSDELKYYKR